MPTITLKLPKALAARLRTAVAQRRVTQSALVREAIEGQLEGGRRPQSPSCLDLARDLAGLLAGPSDLSSARKHLRGYGR